MSLTPQDLLQASREQLPVAVAMRRQIHMHPELGLDLPETRNTVLAALRGLDLEIRESTKTSGIVATLKGAKPGPTLLLRGDMDALPMPENTDVEFRSKVDGAMHACGHDAHTAMLASAIPLLHERRQQLAGNVQFMFQPGEEGAGGARIMLEEGLLDEADAGFAMHIFPLLPCGMVATRSGPMFASADTFKVEIVGRGGHASMPHDAHDPIPVACEIVQALQSFVTRRVNAFDPAVVTVAQIHAGTTDNVIPETAHLDGTIRAVSERTRQHVHEGIDRIARGIAVAHDLDVKIEIKTGYPVTVNHPDFAQFALATARELLGEDQVLEQPHPAMGAEDWSYVLQRIPGCMMILGVRPEDAPPAPCHSNRMVLNEAGMAQGIALHAAMALRYLDGTTRDFSSVTTS